MHYLLLNSRVEQNGEIVYTIYTEQDEDSGIIFTMNNGQFRDLMVKFESTVVIDENITLAQLQPLLGSDAYASVQSGKFSGLYTTERTVAEIDSTSTQIEAQNLAKTILTELETSLDESNSLVETAIRYFSLCKHQEAIYKALSDDLSSGAKVIYKFNNATVTEPEAITNWKNKR